MLTLQEAIELLPAVEEWEKAKNPMAEPPYRLLTIATRESPAFERFYACQKVVDDCNRIYRDAYRELIKTGKV